MPREGHDLMAPIPVRFAMVISIHVPREGHDGWSRAKKNCCFTYFNPRAPRGARRQDNRQQIAPKKFQSTCPARGTTCILSAKSTLRSYFNPRAPRGARPRLFHELSPPAAISIHVPREGHDYYAYINPQRTLISIHVPREGHDTNSNSRRSGRSNFNPRAPRGARRDHELHRSLYS